MTTDERTKELARWLHEEYEKASEDYDWDTQKECQCDFDELPTSNKRVMEHIAKKVIEKTNQGASAERERILKIIKHRRKFMTITIQDEYDELRAEIENEIK